MFAAVGISGGWGAGSGRRSRGVVVVAVVAAVVAVIMNVVVAHADAPVRARSNKANAAISTQAHLARI